MIVGGISMLFGGAAAGDPYFANVSLLLHMNGANGSTSFPDSSPTPKTVSRVGAGVVSTDQSLFGGASYDGLNNSSNYLTVPNSSAFDFSTGDFTFEIAVRLNSAGGSLGALPFTKGVDTGATPFSIGIRADLKVFINVFSSAGTVIGSITSTTAVSLSTWQRISFIRSGSDFRLFLEGVQVGSLSSASSLFNDTSPVSIGNFQPSLETRFRLDGYFDELRITKGVARYTADYTPADAAFPDF